jgi:hypothetical protein
LAAFACVPVLQRMSLLVTSVTGLL